MHQPQVCRTWLVTGVLLLSGFALMTGILEAQPAPAQTMTNRIDMEFVLIPAGTFKMGSNTGDQDERPVHQVTISQAFYMGKYEVTQSQWQAVMGTNPSASPGDANRPVEQVSWNEAQTFISKLNAMEGVQFYRLPTEAEWEYAARAGSPSIYGFGNDPKSLGEYAWYRANSERRTHPVGQKRPNAWGLYDMLGNVWEWVQDWDGKYPTGPETDPKGPETGAYRMRRGCGWNSEANVCRIANRYSVIGYRDDFLGFRVVRVLP